MNQAVTVVIPAFNRSETIGRALDSVIRQTHSNWEAIVTDDASTDSTAEIVQNYLKRESRIRLLNHKQQMGAQAARNTAIRAANGEWIAFLDSDDELVSNSLEIRLKAANENHVQVVHSQCTFVCCDANLQVPEIPPLAGWCYRPLLKTGGPLFPGLLVAVEALKRIGYLDESITSYQEWDTAIRLARYYPFAFVAEAGFICYFGNKDSISVAAPRTARGYEQVFRKHRSEILLQLGPKTLGTHFESAAYLYRQAGLKEDEKRCLSQAALWWPFRPQPLLRRLGFVKS